jgi:hypothetical protein
VENSKSDIVLATLTICVFACVGIGLTSYLPEAQITKSFVALLDTFELTGHVLFYAITGAVTIGLAGALVYGACWAVQHGWMLNHKRRLTGAEARRAENEAELAGVLVTVAPPGSQVYRTDVIKTATSIPLNLQPGRVNGVVVEPTPQENQRWAFFQLTQNISKKPELATEELPQLQAPLPETVDLSHYLMGACSLRRMFLGVGRLPSGQVQPITAPLETLVHIATGGSSGFGKSTFMQSLGYQCLEAKEAVQVVMLDTQGVTFTPFTGHGRLLYPLASDLDNIAAILAELVEEMKRRESLFARYRGVFNISQYNGLDAESLPYIPLFFDEFGIAASDKRITGHIKTLSQGARKAGIFLICGAQTWGHDDIATTIRANLSTSVQFYARSKAQSRILLEDSRAAELTRPGQAFARLPGKADLIEIQAPDPSSVIDVEPMLLDAGPQPSMREMPAIEDEQAQKLGEFAHLVNVEGMSRFDASLQVFGKKYSGEHAMDLKRYLSALSFSSEVTKEGIFGEDDENESE